MAKKIVNVVYKIDSKELESLKRNLKLNEDQSKKLEKELNDVSKSAKNAGDSGAKSFLNFKNVMGAISFAAIGATVLSLGRKIFDLGVKQEQLNIAFNTFLGSAEKGKKLLQELTKFSIVTPFSPDQVNNAAKSLLAFGIEGEKIIPTLKILGDVSSGTGKDLSEMAIIFGQIRSTGRLMGQDLLQLINAGFNPLQIISEKSGKSVAKLKEEMEKGLISFEMVEQAFIDATSAGGLFFNLMEKQSQTIGGIMSAIEGNIEEGFKNIFTAGSGPLKEFVDTLNTLSLAFLEFTKSRDQKKEEVYAETISNSIDEFKNYITTFGDAGKALDFYQKVIDRRVERLKEEYRIARDLADQQITLEDRVKGNTQAKEEEIAQAKIREQQIGDEIDAYELKLDPALKEYILTIGLVGKANKTTEETTKKLTDAQKKARAEFMKMMGFTTASDKVKDAEEKAKKQEKIEKEANERSRKNQEFHDKQKADKLKQQKEHEYQIAEEAANKRLELERRVNELAMQFATELVTHLVMQREIDTQGIRDKYDRELELAGDNDRAKEAIEKERDTKLAQAEARNKEIQKRNARSKILIDTAVAVIKTFSQFGYPAGIIPAALMTALGGVAIANVRKYKKGEVNIDGKGTGTSDSIPAMISKGESVINAQATSKSQNLLEAINDRKIDDRILYSIAANGGRQANFDTKPIVDAINKNKVDYDNHGYTIYKGIQQGSNFKRIIRSKVQGY